MSVSPLTVLQIHIHDNRVGLYLPVLHRCFTLCLLTPPLRTVLCVFIMIHRLHSSCVAPVSEGEATLLSFVFVPDVCLRLETIQLQSEQGFHQSE